MVGVASVHKQIRINPGRCTTTTETQVQSYSCLFCNGAKVNDKLKAHEKADHAVCTCAVSSIRTISTHSTRKWLDDNGVQVLTLALAKI